MEAVRELHQDDADVVDHREEHLAKVLRLLLLPGDERDPADLGHARRPCAATSAPNSWAMRPRSVRVSSRTSWSRPARRGGVELQVGQDAAHLERVDEVRLAGAAHLPLVRPRREHVRAPEKLGPPPGSRPRPSRGCPRCGSWRPGPRPRRRGRASPHDLSRISGFRGR